MRRVYAITLRSGQKEPPIGPDEWRGHRIWVTEKQMHTIMADQDSPTRKGRFYWVGINVFALKDIAYAKSYDYDDPRVQMYISHLEYLKTQIKREEQEEREALAAKGTDGKTY